MKKIVCRIEPFNQVQLIYLYENGNKIDAIESSLDSIHDWIINFMGIHTDIEQIELFGAKVYSNKIKQEIQEEEFKMYSENKIKIICR